MKLTNGAEVIVKPYQEENAEEIVNLINRNFAGTGHCPKSNPSM